MVTVETMQSIIALLTCSTFLFAVLYLSTRIDVTASEESCELYRRMWEREMAENLRFRLQKKRQEEEED